MSSSTEFLSDFKDATQSVISTRRPWPQFLSLSSLSLPSSFSDATTRITQNFTFFLFNYTLIFLLVLLLTLLPHPLSILTFVALFAAWYFLYLAREGDEPLNLFNLVALNDMAVVVGLGFVTVVAMFVTNAWVNVVVSVIVWGLVVCFHGALRGTEDLVVDDHDSPYGPMLSGNPPPSGGGAGGYTRL
ncbi:hypothetical protein TanjilG_00244 [Lupinus angustifolius]|uniref:PRA1 family protein n=1 Tax=Lupinus angustifolius TaxID=3871 RepID=A0A394D3X7_LUPAN|nr:PREDICTED: PRA1 family protein D-like [Lupinus angustifolius]OIW17914.1 hypothetical protein TanjilG_00244 [Lupinus angustifolius]